jgi:uncharacterized protein (TIGR03067 family)
MRTATMSIIALLLIGAAPAPKETAKEVAKELQGTWVVEEELFDGKGHQDPNTSAKVVFKDDTMTWTHSFSKERRAVFIKYTYQLDPEKDPPEMDLIEKWPDGSKGSGRLAVYLLDGDILKVCKGPLDGTRPKEFRSEKDSKNWLMVLKRKTD